MNRTLVRALRALVAGALVAAGVAIFPAAARAAGTADITIDSEWDSGYTASLTIRNPGPTAITGWRAEFDLPAGTTVTHQWNAVLSRSGSHYTLTPAHWNGTIAAGASVTVGWVARGTGKPTGCLLNGGPCAGTPDVTPPSTPTGLHSSFPGGGLIQIDWGPSTDDRGVVGYQVFLNLNQIAAVTGTTFAQIIPPPLSFAYKVRAVDAAGNLSPFAVLPFGYPADTVPPSVPGTPRLSVHDGMLQSDWDPATDNIAVAGYEVTENGVVISRTSGLRAFGPFSIPGVFTVRVRAFDGAGNFGPASVQSIAVDPVPPLPTATTPVPVPH